LIFGWRPALGFVAALLTVTAVVGCGATQSESTSGEAGAKKGGEKVVAFLLPENVNPRWEQQDAPFLKKELGKLDPDIRLDVYNANNDAAAQQRQADQALTKGADVLVVIPVDGEAAAAVTATAAQSKVPVVAYDRMIQGHDIAAWIQADMVAVGRDQAKWLVDHTKDGDTIVQIKGSPTDTNARLFDHEDWTTANMRTALRTSCDISRVAAREWNATRVCPVGAAERFDRSMFGSKATSSDSRTPRLPWTANVGKRGSTSPTWRRSWRFLMT
jgi:ABC-type sugar transport system substrate-binding protein